jgi:PHP family Zn ribbon phosphoesterase
MSPGRIVKEAQSKGIDIIAICDHNSAENVGAVVQASEGKGVTVLPGMEITTKEEVHITALFEHVNDVLELQTLIYENLEGENDETIFGMQVVANPEGEVVSFNSRLLIGATNLSINQTVETIHFGGGLAIAAHIDREGFGIIGQLGIIPSGLPLDALEISPKMEIEEARSRFSEYHHYPFIRSSDAHYLDDIGKGTTAFLLKEGTFKELRMALTGEGNRRICYM